MDDDLSIDTLKLACTCSFCGRTDETTPMSIGEKATICLPCAQRTAVSLAAVAEVRRRQAAAGKPLTH